jgi:hypothetical protein
MVSVEFFATQTGRTPGPRLSIGIATGPGPTYQISWSPGCVNASFDLDAVAKDNCGNTATSTPKVSVTIFCPEVPSQLESIRSLHWSSQLQAAGSAGRVSLNGGLIAIGPGKQEGVAQTRHDENRVDGEVVQGGSRPGLWRFDFSEGVAPGSVRILAGDALEVSDDAVVFRLGGTTGERVSFTFRPRD